MDEIFIESPENEGFDSGEDDVDYDDNYDNYAIHRKTDPKMSQAQFRREVAIYNCKPYGQKPQATSANSRVRRRTEAGDIQHTLRFDQTDHLVEPIQNRRR